MRLLPNRISFKSDPVDAYLKALDGLSTSFKEQSQEQNELDIFRVIALRWGKALPELLKTGLNFHKDSVNADSAEDQVEQKVVDAIEETLRAENPLFHVNPRAVQIEAKLLMEIARSSVQDRMVPALALYIFHQLHLAWDEEHNITMNPPIVQAQGEDFVVVEDEAMDAFMELLQKGKFDAFLADDIAKFIENRHGVEIDHVRRVAQCTGPAAGKLGDAQRALLEQLR